MIMTKNSIYRLVLILLMIFSLTALISAGGEKEEETSLEPREDSPYTESLLADLEAEEYGEYMFLFENK